jgi:hypothetical protein
MGHKMHNYYVVYSGRPMCDTALGFVRLGPTLFY